MPGLRDLSRRIKSVKSTRKITRAMQMVSAAKMRKSQNRALGSRYYAVLAEEIIRNLGNSVASSHPLIVSHPKATEIGAIVITTNRGLVGSFNTNVIAKLRTLANPDVVTMGRKGRDMAQRLRFNIIAEFEKPEGAFDTSFIYGVSKLIEDSYATGKYKKIVVIYNEFVSTLVQKPIIVDILPLKFSMNEVVAKDEYGEVEEKPEEDVSKYLYEPSPEEVLKSILPRIFESKLLQAILESDASEHSARMVMMKNATEAAGDLIDDLTLTYNQLRQNKITTELSEITAGRIALEG